MKAFSAASAICTSQQHAVRIKLTRFVTVVEPSLLQMYVTCTLPDRVCSSVNSISFVLNKECSEVVLCTNYAM